MTWFGLIPWAESIWQHNDNLQVIFHVHQYSYDKELYVDLGFTFVCNVKHGLWGTRLSVWLSQFLALMGQTCQGWVRPMMLLTSIVTVGYVLVQYMEEAPLSRVGVAPVPLTDTLQSISALHGL